jgi:hypothetical protein
MDESIFWGATLAAMFGAFVLARWLLMRSGAGMDEHSRTLEDAGAGGNPAGFLLARSRLQLLQPELLSEGLWTELTRRHPELAPRPRHWWMKHVEEQLHFGDARAAVVVQVEPLRVAAYSEDFDCVALLRFDEKLVAAFGLRPGTRLITANTYSHDPSGKVAGDLAPTREIDGSWHNFTPLIVDFLSEEQAKLQAAKAKISNSEWARTEELGRASQATPRDGRPLFAGKPFSPPGSDG